MAQNVRSAATLQQQSSLAQQSLDLEVPQFQQRSDSEGGKEATTHDFLSLYGRGSASLTETTATRGSISSVTTQDLLQPLEKGLKPHSSSLLSQGLGRLHTSSADDYVAGQQTSYALVNGTLELPSNAICRVDRAEGVTEKAKESVESLPYLSSATHLHLKYRPSDGSYAPKQPVPIMSKQWQHQQAGSELFDASERPPRVLSEEDEEDDEESLEHGHNPRRESFHQKCDISQKLEGKNNDSKGGTPRSKHSATEQRRRSKINDRFQMLRHLVPNVDQKRDKASFLLEVIDYIKVLQEKVRKYDAAEHGRQQERLKTISWDVTQRNPTLTADAAHVPLISTVSLNTKQLPNSNGFVRSMASSLAVTHENENEFSRSELMASSGHILPLPDRHAQCPQAHHSSHENQAVPVTFPTQPPAVSTLGRISTHVFQSFPQATSEAHARCGHPPHHEKQTLTPFAESKLCLHSKVEVVPLPQLRGNSLPLQSSNNVVELKHGKLKIYEHSQCNSSIGICPPSNKHEKPDRRPVLDGDHSEAEQNDGVQGEEQEPLIIQGGIINVSSIYSQGLLDTLTRALQSSGLDLTQATISVQIDLGKPGGASVGASSTRMGIPSTAVSQQKSEEVGRSSELEHLRKKPKIEADI